MAGHRPTTPFCFKAAHMALSSASMITAQEHQIPHTCVENGGANFISNFKFHEKMRTRFLNTDYFSSPIEPLSFLHLHLPLPHLPPSSHFSSSIQDQNLLRFDPLPVTDFPFQNLPIDAALSTFLAQVIPQPIHVEHADFSEQGRFSFNVEEALNGAKEGEDQSVLGFEGPEKTVEPVRDDKLASGFDVFEFEAPELDVLLEDTGFPEDTIQTLCEVREIEKYLDFNTSGLQMEDSYKAQESVYFVEDVAIGYNIDHDADSFKDEDSVQGYSNRSPFPLFEVDETSLNSLSNLSMEDNLLGLLENTKSHWVQEDNLLSDGMETFGSVQHDLFEFFSNHCLQNQCLEYELASQAILSGTNVVSLVEDLPTKEGSIVVLEEFKFLDLDSSQLYEVFFENQVIVEPEACELMFCEGGNFKNFSQLVVSFELTLVDDIFKSMPIPIISDADKTKSMYASIEETLAELKPRSLSTSDGIYLDWYFFEEDKWNHEINPSYLNILQQLDLKYTDTSMEFSDCGKLILEFIFSDDFDGQKMEEYRESLKVPLESTSTGQLVDVASRNLLDGDVLKPSNGVQLAEQNPGKAPVFFKSISEFNDLDYFLNPAKATSRENITSAVKEPATLSKDEGSHSMLAQSRSMNAQKLEKLLNTVPIQANNNMRTSEAADEVMACHMPMAAFNVPCALKSEDTLEDMASFPKTIIVVNTQNFDKEMLISRRSTYQRILAMEKEGAQVVERDLNLPVDVILSCAICLVWYDCRNIQKKATTFDEASSSLPLCIENIATNVLTLLSFKFSTCIMVFEGELSFLSDVMEYSDGLYAAAASLGIDLQLHCSHCSDLTNEIILSCILCAAKLCRAVYPKMPESETLAESFLTVFPSLHPLTAHAILSSGGTLIEFLESSHEQRILSLQRFQAPGESIALFNALCKYGEREDSKSMMTDCSSSTSSCPDSERGRLNIDSERKQQKNIITSQSTDIPVEDWKQFTEDMLCPPGAFKEYNHMMLPDSETFDQFKGPISSSKDLFSEQEGLDLFPAPSKLYESPKFRDTDILNEIQNPRLPLNDKLVDRYYTPEMAPKDKFDWNNTRSSEDYPKAFTGEVIDLTDDPLLDASVPYWLPEVKQDSTMKSKAARRLAFDKNSHPTFPTAAEIESSSDLWDSMKGERQSLIGDHGFPSLRDMQKNNDPVKHHKILFERVLKRSAENRESPFKEEISYCGGTPLSKAIRSACPQPGSPWTIEFLNRVREKSRLRKQSLPCETSSPGFVHSGNSSRCIKRRSPSILEFFKYREGSTPERKKHKQPIKLSGSSRNEKNSASLLSTRTPIDKKSNQTLSFEPNGGGSQTRLVWSDGSAQRYSKRVRKI